MTASQYKSLVEAGNSFNTYGLAGGATPTATPETDYLGIVPTCPTAKLTDIVGSQPVPVTASVCVGASAASELACTGGGGYWYPADKAVTFGDGPLSVFSNGPDNDGGK